MAISLLSKCRSGPRQGILPFRLRGHWHVARIVVEDRSGHPVNIVEVVRMAHRSSATSAPDLAESRERSALARISGLCELLREGRSLCPPVPDHRHDRKCERLLDPIAFARHQQRTQRFALRTCFAQERLPPEAWAIALTGLMAARQDIPLDDLAAKIYRLREDMLVRFVHCMLEASARDDDLGSRMLSIAIAELETGS